MKLTSASPERRPVGLAVGTNLSGLSGLVGIWGGGIGCVGAIQNHQSGDFGRGEPLLQLVTASGLIGLGLVFLLLSYGLDRGRPWSRHLVLTGWLGLLALVAFGWGRPDALQQRLLLGTAGFTLLATAYFYVKPNVVAYYRRFEQVGLQ